MRSRPTAALFAFGAVFYSSWLLAGALPTGLSPVHGYASELFARGEPFRWLFGGADVITAGLVGVAAWWCLTAVGGRGVGARWARAGWGCLIVFALCTVVDVLFPLDCPPSRAPCARAEEAGRLTWSHDTHLVASVLANTAVLVAMTALALAARHPDAGPVPPTRPGAALSALAILATLVTAVLGARDAHVVSGFLPTGGQGVAQRVQVGLVSVWLLVTAASLHRADRAAIDDGRTRNRH